MTYEEAVSIVGAMSMAEIEELKKRSKRLNNNIDSKNITELLYKRIDNILDEVEKETNRSVSYVELADAIGKIMIEQYGSHNFKDFLKTLDIKLS
jgi:hypothetical protein